MPYPDMYSEKQPLFNCYQRAHQVQIIVRGHGEWAQLIYQLYLGRGQGAPMQNTLENFPPFKLLFLIDCVFYKILKIEQSQNTLENIPTFLSLLFPGGLFSPKWAAGDQLYLWLSYLLLGYYTSSFPILSDVQSEICNPLFFFIRQLLASPGCLAG